MREERFGRRQQKQKQKRKKGDFGEQAQDVSPHVRRGLVDGNVCENRKRERERERDGRMPT
jgi:hypothetical protein